MAAARAELESLLTGAEARRHADLRRPPGAQADDDRVAPTGCAGPSMPRSAAGCGAAISRRVDRRRARRACTTLFVAMAAAATARGEVVALIDTHDRFDPVSADAAGVDLTRLLWIREVGQRRSRAEGDEPGAAGRRLRGGRLRSRAMSRGPALRQFPHTTWMRIARIDRRQPHRGAAARRGAHRAKSRRRHDCARSIAGARAPVEWAGTTARDRRLRGLTIRPRVIRAHVGAPRAAAGLTRRDDHGHPVVRRSHAVDSRRPAGRRVLVGGRGAAAAGAEAPCPQLDAAPGLPTFAKATAVRLSPGGCLRPRRAVCRPARCRSGRDRTADGDRAGFLAADRAASRRHGRARRLRTAAAVRRAALDRRASGACRRARRSAIAVSQTAALLLARTGAGVRTVAAGDPAIALRDVPLDRPSAAGREIDGPRARRRSRRARGRPCPRTFDVLRRWGLTTIGEFAALPAAALSARLGAGGIALQRLARGIDPRPLVPDPGVRRFVESFELEWPIEHARAVVVRLRAAARSAGGGARTRRSRRRSRCTCSCGSPIGPRTRARSRCRRRCAIRVCCARCCCSISSRIRPPAADRRRHHRDRSGARPHRAVLAARAAGAVAGNAGHADGAPRRARRRHALRLAAAARHASAGRLDADAGGIRRLGARGFRLPRLRRGSG